MTPDIEELKRLCEGAPVDWWGKRVVCVQADKILALIARLDELQRDRDEWREIAAEGKQLLEETEAGIQQAQKAIGDFRDAYPQLCEMNRDAARYRWLREQHWNESHLYVLSNPRKRANLLGLDCPSGSRLDEAIDAALAKEQP